MRTLRKWLLAASLALCSPGSAHVVHMFGALRDFAANYPIPGKNAEPLYRQPNPLERKLFQKCLHYIYKGDFDTASRLAAAIDYSLMLFEGEHVVLAELLRDECTRGYRGLYIIRPNAPRQLVIEVPHPIHDSNTRQEGIDIYLQCEATALLMAGCYRYNHPTPLAHRPHRTVSDMAHAPDTLFQTAHEFLFQRLPGSISLSLHGMVAPKNRQDLSISNGTRSRGPEASYSIRLCEAVNHLISLDPCDERRALSHQIPDSHAVLAGTQNVQGRYSNGSSDPTRWRVLNAPQPERFLHIEQTPEIRRSAEDYAILIEAIRSVFD